jgi:hypothetical protein
VEKKTFSIGDIVVLNGNADRPNSETKQRWRVLELNCHDVRVNCQDFGDRWYPAEWLSKLPDRKTGDEYACG